MLAAVAEPQLRGMIASVRPVDGERREFRGGGTKRRNVSGGARIDVPPGRPDKLPKL